MTFSMIHCNTWDDRYAFSMQGESIIEQTNGYVMCLQFSMKEENILEHTNAKCYLCTL